MKTIGIICKTVYKKYILTNILIFTTPTYFRFFADVQLAHMTFLATHMNPSQGQKSQIIFKTLFEQTFFRIKYNIFNCQTQNSANVV
jgi:hypothetical protein